MDPDDMDTGDAGENEAPLEAEVNNPPPAQCNDSEFERMLCGGQENAEEADGLFKKVLKNTPTFIESLD